MLRSSEIKPLLNKRNYRTNTILYGTNTIKARAVKAWNEINTDLCHLKLQNVSKAVCKQKIFQHLLDKYPDNENDMSDN